MKSCPSKNDADSLPEGRRIDRSLTALSRSELSRPVKLAINDGFIAAESSVFDFGCGRGDDIRFLTEMGIQADGWDPHYRSSSLQREADIVNLGYILNVIEDGEERLDVVSRAWNLARKLLIVAAQVVFDDRLSHKIPYNDGYVTRRGTFQRFFEQGELKELIESVCASEACAAGPGIYYVFKDESLRHTFLASRFTRRCARPRVSISQARFDEHRELFESFMAVISELGRVPEPDEFDRTDQLTEVCGSLNRAFSLVRKATGQKRWDALTLERRGDILVMLAVMRFTGRPSLSQLPIRFQRDIRHFEGSYKQACDEADKLLFAAGDQALVAATMKSSSIGKFTPSALYIHESAVACLDPLLRVYEACARKLLGLNDPGTLIKLHRSEPAVSYLFYPEFFEEAHPSLHGSIHVSLRTLCTTFRDYSKSRNPPILHRKELFLDSDNPNRERFALLTGQEEQAGLLADSKRIGNKVAWLTRLRDSARVIVDHALCPADAMNA